MDDRPIWEMSSGDWIQDDEQNRFFILNRESGEEGNQSGLDIIVGAKWHHDNKANCGGFFPPEFDHCPFCGCELAVGDHNSDIWVPPYGDGSGLRKVAGRIDMDAIPVRRERTRIWVDIDEQVFSLPRIHGDYEFIVAPLGTKSPVLVAFDRASGVVDYFSPAQKKWIPLAPSPARRVGTCELPNWSWSAAFLRGKAGFAVPTREGPVWLAIDWRHGTYAPESGQGDCIGGVATLQNQIFIPVLTEGSVTIQSFDFSAFKWKQVEDCKRDVLQDFSEAQRFSVPIGDEGRGVIYWIGKDGLITFDLPHSNCMWRPWETGAFPCRAVPELGPPYQDQIGNFWQICYNDHDDAFRYYKLNGNEGDREDVDGGCFSSGVSCFSKSYDLWDRPWAKLDTKRQDVAKMIRTPLLCLDEESKTSVTVGFASGSTLPLLDIIKDRENTYPAVLRIESPSDLPVELRMPKAFNIHTPWELRLFIYQDHLFVYSSEEAVCYRWRLK